MITFKNGTIKRYKNETGLSDGKESMFSIHNHLELERVSLEQLPSTELSILWIDREHICFSTNFEV